MPGIIKERLKSVKSLVPFGTRLLDVGSDHAALPISLLKERKITSAVISDINEKPLERARAETAKAGMTDMCRFVLSDGFKNVAPDSFDTAAICGMGGTLIVNILSQGALCGNLKKEHTLIIQPMTDAAAVRKYLWDSGYDIVDEIFTSEGRYDADRSRNKAKPYVAVKASFDGKRRAYDLRDLFFGKKRERNAAFELYRAKTVRMLRKKLSGLLISLKATRSGKKMRYTFDKSERDKLLCTTRCFERYIRKELIK